MNVENAKILLAFQVGSALSTIGSVLDIFRATLDTKRAIQRLTSWLARP